MKQFFSSLFLLLIAIILLFFLHPQSTSPLHLSPTQRIQNHGSIAANTNPHMNFDHIVVIMMENKSYTGIIGNPDAPYINSLLKKGSLLAQYHAVTHPSLPNYLALIGGSTFGITSDCTDCYIAAPNLVDQLDAGHKSWKAYMESMPSPCFQGSEGEYAQKHDPFMYFNDIRNNTSRCSNIVPFDSLSVDLKNPQKTPNFIFISPNLCNDMHDCSIKQGDQWLAGHVPSLLSSSAFTAQNSLLVLTWDEDDGSVNNHIATIVIGKNIKQGFVSDTSYTHYSLLHTIEAAWSMSPLTVNAEKAAMISDIVK